MVDRGGVGGRVAAIATSLSIDEDDHDHDGGGHHQHHDHGHHRDLGYVGMSSPGGVVPPPPAGAAAAATPQSWRPPTPPRSPASSSSPSSDNGGGRPSHSIFSWLGFGLGGGGGGNERVAVADDDDEEGGVRGGGGATAAGVRGGGRRRRGVNQPSGRHRFDESLLLHEGDGSDADDVGGGGGEDAVAAASRRRRAGRRRARERLSFRRRIADSVGSDTYVGGDGYRNVVGAVVGSPSRLRSRPSRRSDGNDDNDIEGGRMCTSYAAMGEPIAEPDGDAPPPPPPRGRSPERVREECSFFYGGADDGQRPRHDRGGSSGSTLRSLWSDGDGSSSASRTRGNGERRRRPGILEEDAATWRPSVGISNRGGGGDDIDTADDGDDPDSRDPSPSSVIHTSLPIANNGHRHHHHPSSPTSFVRKSSLYAATESADVGRVQIRLPIDNVRLVMDPSLEPGVLCVVVTDDLARLRRRLYWGDDRYYYPSTGGGKTVVDGIVKIEDDEVLQRRMQAEPLRYVLTVDDDLYRRVIDEMAHARNSPCGLYFCCHDGSEDDPHGGRVHIIVAVLILAAVFVFLLADTIVWPFT